MDRLCLIFAITLLNLHFHATSPLSFCSICFLYAVEENLREVQPTPLLSSFSVSENLFLGVKKNS